MNGRNLTEERMSCGVQNCPLISMEEDKIVRAIENLLDFSSFFSME